MHQLNIFTNPDIDYSKSKNRIHRNGALIAYHKVCKRHHVVFADNDGVVSQIDKYIRPGLVGVRKMQGSQLGCTEVFIRT